MIIEGPCQIFILVLELYELLLFFSEVGQD